MAFSGASGWVPPKKVEGRGAWRCLSHRYRMHTLCTRDAYSMPLELEIWENMNKVKRLSIPMLSIGAGLTTGCITRKIIIEYSVNQGYNNYSPLFDYLGRVACARLGAGVTCSTSSCDANPQHGS